MTSIDEAKKFAEAHFPEGPEKLAKKLGIEIYHGTLTGCDGWALSGPAGKLIRINSSVSVTRQRFTLAHELGHLLLAIPTVVGESVYDSLKSNSDEERRVNDLASELLLPESVVCQYVPSVPIVASQLKRLAEKSKVSQLSAAIRVANLSEEIGLVNASVAFFQNGGFEWHWSKTLRMTPQDAVALFQAAKRDHPKPVRIPQEGDVIVASVLSNTGFASETLFVQLLPAAAGNSLSKEELKKQLEEFLFKDDNDFRMQLQGVFGAFLPKCRDKSLEVAFAEFYALKVVRWKGNQRIRLDSIKGRQYVRLRLEDWCL
ncbi:MAG TPA: ImmA/IrrE family metallo-endopeptidase [Pyrinomonadaceae bacterium]